MIPYAELERALARWKARSRSGATEIGGHDIVHSSEVSDLGPEPRVPHPNGTSSEIDINELVESYDD